MRYQAVLFDMDGVLIESEWLMRATAIQALADYGIRAQDEDFMEFTGCGEDRFIGGVAEKHGAVYDKAMKELAYDYYGKRVMTEVEIPAGVGEMLQALHARGLKLAVCSAADLRKVKYNLAAVGAPESLFTALVTGSDVERKKPLPGYLPGGSAPGGRGARGLPGGGGRPQRNRRRARRRDGRGRCAHQLFARDADEGSAPRVPAGPDCRFAGPGAAEVRNCDIVTESGHAMW